jgi:EAL and modified HD-GYP domain-containing signal transduction protein
MGIVGAGATRSIHVARQPLYDRSGAVQGYELLFRGDAAEQQASKRNAYATSNVIVGAFTDVGLANLVGDRLCFVNLTREFVTGELELPFGPERVVLEILESIEVDEEVIAGVKNLVARGYQVALDDFVWDSGHELLLPFARYVKLEVAGVDPAELAGRVERIRAYPKITLIAERLEDDTDLELARRLGFELFQGYALAKPQTTSTVGLSPARMQRLQLVAALADPVVDVDKVVSMVSADPALGFRLLRATNSAATGITGKVSSVHDAIVLLGLRRVCQWVTLMLVGDLAEASEDLVTATLTRARLCRGVAAQLSLPQEAAFTVGLLSSVAEIIGEDPAEMAGNLPLTDDVASALTTGTGPLGDVLALVRKYEQADVKALATQLADTGLSGEAFALAYLKAVAWVEQSMRVVLPKSA